MPNGEQNSGDRNGFHGFGGGRQEASASGPQQQETGNTKPGPERNGDARPQRSHRLDEVFTAT
jgi:hypothetical protein